MKTVDGTFLKTCFQGSGEVRPRLRNFDGDGRSGVDVAAIFADDRRFCDQTDRISLTNGSGFVKLARDERIKSP